MARRSSIPSKSPIQDLVVSSKLRWAAVAAPVVSTVGGLRWASVALAAVASIRVTSITRMAGCTSSQIPSERLGEIEVHRRHELVAALEEFPPKAHIHPDTHAGLDFEAVADPK